MSEGFRVHASPRGRIVVDAALEEPVLALDLHLRETAHALLAKDPASTGRAATVIVPLQGREKSVHLRPVRHGGWLGPLWGGRILGLSRPITELRVTRRLRDRGAPVPRAVLVAGWRSGPFWSAILGTLEFEDSHDGLEWLRGDPTRDALHDVARAAGTAVRRFHEAGGHHADLHLKNLLVREEPEEPVRARVLVIDLDRAKAAQPPDPARRMRELMRLYRSLLKRGVYEQIGRDGRGAFLDAYLAGDEALAAAMLRHLPRERRRVARHALTYRSSSTST